MKPQIKFVLIMVVLSCTIPDNSYAENILSLSTDRPEQGSLVRLEVMAKNCDPEVTFQEHKIALNRDGNSLTGFFAIDLSANVGKKFLEIHPKNCRPKAKYNIKREIIVREGNYPLERLTIEDTSQVSLSEESLKRHKREKKKINHALSTRSNQRHWTRDFHRPLNKKQFSAGSNFGSRRIINGRKRSPHGGEDYTAGIGEPIYSINHGKVILTGDFFFSGKSVFVDHGRGLISMYFHLSELTVTEGEFISEGGKIGEAGSTGRATGPHLHLGTQWNGATFDPDYLFQEKSINR